MDLIDREDAINAIYHHLPYVSKKRATIILREVQGMELIRCKDCKHVSVEPCKDYENVYVCDRNYWTRAQGGNMPNDFCSKGERREE